MKLAPIQLKKYFITHLRLETQEHFDPKKPHLYDFKELQNVVNIQLKQNDPAVYQVSLVLKHVPKPKDNLPYAFDMQIVGIFKSHPKSPKEKADDLVKINGPAVLFGAAREILAQVTGRGPWGALLLPTVNFLPDNQTKNKKLNG